MHFVVQMDQTIFFSIDVECVATGTDHNSRAVAQVSLVVSFPFSTPTRISIFIPTNRRV